MSLLGHPTEEPSALASSFARQQVCRHQMAGPPSLPAEQPYGDRGADHEDSDENARFE